MTSYQNAVTYAQDQLRQGKVSVNQANVMIVQMVGVQVVAGKLPASVRKALNEAVKNGDLGHIKKDGLKPEVYHHKNARASALDTQSRIATEAVESIKKCLA